VLRQELEQPPRRPAVDGGGRPRHAFARLTHLTCDLERERGAEQQTVAVSTAVFAMEHRPQRARVVGRIAAGQIRGRARRQPVVGRRAHAHLDSARAHVEQPERTHRRRLIPPGGAVNHEGALDG